MGFPSGATVLPGNAGNGPPVPPAKAPTSASRSKGKQMPAGSRRMDADLLWSWDPVRTTHWFPHPSRVVGREIIAGRAFQHTRKLIGSDRWGSERSRTVCESVLPHGRSRPHLVT